MAGLHVPLPTLRRHPHGCPRTARGRCDSLRLHRNGLSPSTLCRSVPAHNMTNRFEVSWGQRGTIATLQLPANSHRATRLGVYGLRYQVPRTVPPLQIASSRSTMAAEHSAVIPGSHMKIVKKGFVRPWSIVHPTVTRYLDSRFIDEFFTAGRFRLPTFSLFRGHADEHRGDEMEGRVAAEIRGPNSHRVALTWNGQAVFVLCGGLVEGEHMERAFGTNAAIRIHDVVSFADVISRHIPGFVEGLQGNCIYREDTTLRKAVSGHFEPPISEEHAEAWAAKEDRFIAQQTVEGYFLKRLMYAEQNEYRLIWFAHGAETKEPLFVTCPEARQYCERL